MTKYGIRCVGCGQTVPEGIGHTCTQSYPYSESSTKFVIKQYPIAGGPCPSCARHAAKMKDREGLAKMFVRISGEMNRYCDYDVADRFSDAVLRWMEE